MIRASVFVDVFELQKINTLSAEGIQGISTWVRSYDVLILASHSLPLSSPEYGAGL